MREDVERLGIRLTPEDGARRIAEQTTALVGRGTDDEIRAFGELATLATGAQFDTRDDLLAFCLRPDMQTSTVVTAMAGGVFAGLETLNDADLEHDLRLLAERMGIKLPRLFRGPANDIGARTAFDYQDELPGIICGGRMLALAPDQVLAVLCHEFSHVARHDYLFGALACAAIGVALQRPDPPPDFREQLGRGEHALTLASELAADDYASRFVSARTSVEALEATGRMAPWWGNGGSAMADYEQRRAATQRLIDDGR